MLKFYELIFCLKLDLYPRFTLSFCGYFLLVFYISMWMIVLHKPRFGNVNKKTILGQHNPLFAYASLWYYKKDLDYSSPGYNLKEENKTFKKI